MTYTIEKITTLIGARRYGQTDATIGWLLTDSRSLCFPEQTLFFALRTQRNDGHRYIPELYRRGVRNFVVEQLPEMDSAMMAEANFLKVPSPLAALQRLAERHRDEFNRLKWKDLGKRMALPDSLWGNPSLRFFRSEHTFQGNPFAT